MNHELVRDGVQKLARPCLSTNEVARDKSSMVAQQSKARVKNGGAQGGELDCSDGNLNSSQNWQESSQEGGLSAVVDARASSNDW